MRNVKEIFIVCHIVRIHNMRVKNKGPLNLYFFYVSAKQELSQKKTRADSSIGNTDFLPITDFFLP